MLKHASGVVARIVLLAALGPAAVPAQESPSTPSNAVSLTEAQRRAFRTIEAEAAAKAAAVLLGLAQAAKEFNTNLLSATPDPEIDRKLAQEMSQGFGEIIEIRLARIRSAARTLMPEQRLALTAELKKPGAPGLFDDLVRKVLGDPKQ